MPITPYLDGRTFDPGTERVMGDAFEMALAALRISNPSDHVAAIVARRILALAKNGESNADHLCDQALASLGRVLRSQRRRHLPSATAKRLTAARAFWVGGPDEWFGIGIGIGDEAVDGKLQVNDRLEQCP
jgi:hypothetical protein